MLFSSCSQVSTIARVRQLGIQPAISEPERGELRKCLRRIKQYSAWEDPGIAAMAMSCLAVLSVGRVRDAAAVDYDLHATLLRALARCYELYKTQVLRAASRSVAAARTALGGPKNGAREL
jgi:hypothetical protein